MTSFWHLYKPKFTSSGLHTSHCTVLEFFFKQATQVHTCCTMWTFHAIYSLNHQTTKSQNSGFEYELFFITPCKEKFTLFCLKFSLVTHTAHSRLTIKKITSWWVILYVVRDFGHGTELFFTVRLCSSMGAALWEQSSLLDPHPEPTMAGCMCALLLVCMLPSEKLRACWKLV